MCGRCLCNLFRCWTFPASLPPFASRCLRPWNRSAPRNASSLAPRSWRSRRPRHKPAAPRTVSVVPAEQTPFGWPWPRSASAPATPSSPRPLASSRTVSSILRAGATPVLADIDARTFNLSPQAAAHALDSHPREQPPLKALMPVHLYGQCADMDAFGALATRHNLQIVEDAAQAFGARWSSQSQPSPGQPSPRPAFSGPARHRRRGAGPRGRLQLLPDQEPQRLR